MDLERVIAALAPRDVVGRAPLDVADLAYDTRAVTPGALFFCVRGANVDGHELAPQAVAAGSVALVVERPLSPQVPQLVVADSRAAMATAADVFFGHPTHELEVAGVTGTNGKTTTAHLVYSILAAAARILGIEDAVVARGLEAVRGVPGRFESVDEGQPFEVVVDYSHTPDSLENALRAARDLAATGRVLCVFGCGGDRDRDKRPLMGRVASEPGDLFVAVGRGVEFLEDARARGAAATLVPDDAFAAMAALGAAVRDKSNARVVGITGSMGKTGTKDILAALCRPQARTVAAEASFNNELGVPLTLCRPEPDTEVCILELAMRGFGQIAELCAIARPEIGAITNIGPVHLELVGDVEGVRRAKAELVEALPAGGTAVVPEDFPVERDDVEVVRVGVPDAVVEEGRTLLGGVSFGFTARHHAANAAVALAVLDALGLPRPARVEVPFSRWRGEEVPLPGGGLLINDAYNANPV